MSKHELLVEAYVAFLIRSLRRMGEEKSGQAWHLPLPSLAEKTLTIFQDPPLYGRYLRPTAFKSLAR
jgi:hypothetical protein